MVRRVRLVAVFLLLGAAVNVVLVWGFLAWRPLDARMQIRDPASTDKHWWQTFVAAEKMMAVVLVHEEASLSLRLGVGDGGGRVSLANGEWLVFEVPMVEPVLVAAEVSAGWPLRSAAVIATDKTDLGLSDPLLADFSPVQIGISSIATASPLVAGSKSWEEFDRIRILWLGMVGNTLLYATFAWLLCAASLAILRRHRHRRGLCEMCAYPVGASPVCTECGHTLPMQARSQ